jgi:nicotinamidase-related amidase
MMKTFYQLSLMIFLGFSCNQSDRDLILRGRSLIKMGDNTWEEKMEIIHWEPENTAIIVCDMWDRHWCEGASRRVAEMAPRMNHVIQRARQKGVTIIYAPSGTMDFYAGFPQRDRLKNARYDPSSDLIQDWYYLDPEKESELPVDDSDGGCDTNPEPDRLEVWSRQIAVLEIDEKDGISDNGREINNFFIERGIQNVILMGVHINMCVLGRSFGVRGQVARGRNVVVVRDLTDSMYNPGMPPFVSHEEGTRRIIHHIERYWCPSIESKDLL